MIWLFRRMLACKTCPWLSEFVLWLPKITAPACLTFKYRVSFLANTDVFIIDLELTFPKNSILPRFRNANHLAFCWRDKVRQSRYLRVMHMVNTCLNAKVMIIRVGYLTCLVLTIVEQTCVHCLRVIQPPVCRWGSWSCGQWSHAFWGVPPFVKESRIYTSSDIATLSWSLRRRVLSENILMGLFRSGKGNHGRNYSWISSPGSRWLLLLRGRPMSRVASLL